jgi:hypothetical protein
MLGWRGSWDVDERYELLSKASDPLQKIDAVVPWDIFRKLNGQAAETLRWCHKVGYGDGVQGAGLIGTAQSVG